MLVRVVPEGQWQHLRHPHWGAGVDASWGVGLHNVLLLEASRGGRGCFECCGITEAGYVAGTPLGNAD